MVNTPPAPLSLRSSSSSLRLVVDGNFDDSKPSSSSSKDERSNKETIARAVKNVKTRTYLDRREEIKRNWQFRAKTSRGSSTKDEYEFVHTRSGIKSTDIKGGIAALVKGILGGGMMAIHESYKYCGLWSALAVNAMLGVFIAFCMYELTRSAQKMYHRLGVPTMSYPDLAEVTIEMSPWICLQGFSRCFRHSVEALICLNLFSSCCVYHVMMARSLKQLVDATEGLSDKPPSIRVYIACLMLPCLVIAVFTNVKNLAPFSIVLGFFIILLAVSTIYYSVICATTSPLDRPAFKSMYGLFEAIGGIMYALDGTGNILSVENSLKNPKDFNKVLFGGMTVVTLLVMIIGFFGYWGFGEASLSPITLNYPWGSFTINLKMFLAMMAYITFGIHFFIPFNLLWFYISFCHDPDYHWIWEKVYRTLVLAVITVVALAIPDISRFISLVGSMGFTFLGFIFPAFIAINIDWEDPGPGRFYWRLLKTCFIIILGMNLCIVGTCTNIMEMSSKIRF